MTNLVLAPPTDPPNIRDGSSIWWIVVPFEEQFDDLKKKLAKNNDAKMVLYNALPKKEYERIFMCKTAKDIWQSLLITYQGNSQVKDNKIDLLVQQYEQFTILEEGSIDSGFARFNTIITSLKALDEGKKKRIESIALKSKKYSSDDETLTSGSDGEEYAMAVRNFKKFFRRKGKFVRQPREEKKSFRQRDEKKEKSDRKCFRCHGPNHLIGDCPKPPRNKDQKAFIGGSCSYSENDAEDKTNDETCLMAQTSNEEFEMSMMGELNFFLGLQIKQMEDKIFFNQSKYIKEMLKKFGLEDSKPTKTPMSKKIKHTKNDETDSVDSSKYQENYKTTHLEVVKRIFRYIRGTNHLGLWYLKRAEIETIVYVDSDHAGDYVYRKSTSGVGTMGCCLTSWFAKKQTDLVISTTKAEYVSTRKACQQALWMIQALIDYGIRLDNVPNMCNYKGTIDLSKNPIQHSRTKHIEIHHHFLCDNVQKGNISIEKVSSEDNIADIFTKPLKHEVFNYLRLGLEMMELIMDSDSPSSQK
nr:copia protein [Tanacetum cinerariifolium]